ncbi:MAG TPA: hypothetical protein VH186_22200 [Chloroflexia bacterium]|nr:hypothetical protein [Chloroflexia bacterium]
MSDSGNRQDETKPAGSGRNVNTGGGMYNEGGTINNNGGINISGTSQGAINYYDNRISAGETAKLDELLAQLRQQVTTLPATTPEEKANKEEVHQALQALEGEVETVKKDPEKKPNKFTMNGLLLAFKKVGGPVLGTALTLLGQPVMGAAVNQLAQNVQAEEKK